jgi:hypothetical protein
MRAGDRGRTGDVRLGKLLRSKGFSAAAVESVWLTGICFHDLILGTIVVGYSVLASRDALITMRH